MVFKFPEWDRITSVPIHEVIVPEEDHNTFSISHPQHLLLIDTPLAAEDDTHHGHASHSTAPPKTPSHAVHEFRNDSTSSSSESGNGHAVIGNPDQPTLKRAHEAPTIQLFFDLFFVANLTTFTTIHEVDDWSSEFLFAIWCSDRNLAWLMTYSSQVLLRLLWSHLVYLVPEHSVRCPV